MRKSFEPEPLIAALLRDARPTACELEGRPNLLDLRDAQREGREINDTPDPRKGREAVRARDLARAELVWLYRKAKRAHTLDKFQPDARFFIKDLMREAAKAGAPARQASEAARNDSPCGT
jgi:hypothetical protein